MRIKHFSLAASALILLSLPALGRELAPHPRLYLGSTGRSGVPSVAELRARTLDPAYAPAWERVLRSASVADKALVFLLSGDTTRLNGVRKALGGTVDRYEPLVQRCLAFDWAYQALSAGERRLFAGKLLESARAVAGRYQIPTVYHNMCRGRNMAQGLAVLAAWEDEPEAEKLFPQVRAELQEFLEVTGDGAAADDMAGRAGYGGGWPEGYDYDRHGAFYALQLLLAWRSAGLEDHISGSSYWRDKVLWLVYGTAPDGSFLLPYEDNDWPVILRQDREMMTFLTGELRSGHGRRWLDTFADSLSCRPYWDLIFSDPSVEPAPAGELPASRLIPGVGLALMRSSWSGQASFVHFHCGPWYTYHQHAAQGSFTVFRNRPLIVEPGVYNGEVDEHYVNWRIRTVSHNCITVLDTSERFLGPTDVPEPANDGGQIIQNWTLKPATREQWYAQRRMRDTGRITSFLTGPSHDLAVGEAAGAYNPDKVRRWCRQLLFIKPDWVVLCDLVQASGADFPKTLLLHTPQQVSLRQKYAATADRSLTIYTLLPEGAQQAVAGGPDEPFAYGGTNWASVPAYNGQYDNAWRLEVKAPDAEETVFLTVLYLPETPPEGGASPVVELTGSAPRRVSLTLEGGRYRVAFDPRAELPYSLSGPGIGYSVSGRVLDSKGLPVEKAALRLEGAADLRTAADNHGQYLFTGLKPGNYTVILEGSGKVRSLDITDHHFGEVNFE
ncbi:MAG: heparinase II/III family protein [Candidatus Glassbacteria bacterium]|nr:heparinase II/III family protein [Candidatus Glassbacteria bacterium]